MTIMVGKCEGAWVVIFDDVWGWPDTVDKYEKWDRCWAFAKKLFDAGVFLEVDTVRDEYATNPEATIDGLPVIRSERMIAELKRKHGYEYDN